MLALVSTLSRTLSRTYFRKRRIGIVTKAKFSYQNLRVYEDMIRAICLTSGVRLLVEIDKMTAKLASVWEKAEEHMG